MSYESPIELLVTNVYDQILKEQDEHIYQAVLHYIPNVDKAELIRALKYDRDQYEKGYADGKADALNKLVRCGECAKRYVPYECGLWHGRLDDRHFFGEWGDDFWCAKGERKTE